jgi:hypothetical protein
MKSAIITLRQGCLPWDLHNTLGLALVQGNFPAPISYSLFTHKSDQSNSPLLTHSPCPDTFGSLTGFCAEG